MGRMYRIDQHWDDEIVPQLIDYIRVPAKSPHFDPDWQRNGHIEKVIGQARRWVEAQRIEGLELEVVRLESRTPVLFFDVPARGAGASSKSVVLYGHLDKQPEMTGWREGLGPWTPVLEQGKLYGRGGADDGYAVFAAIAAIKSLESRPRCIGLIETCEESGSYDLPAYLDALAPRMGDVGLVIALDSGAGNYDQLWVTTSLRGLVNGTLRVDVLSEGVHSGDAGGVVPSSFRIARELLDRIEDSKFSCEIPADRLDQARRAAAILGDGLWQRFPLTGDPMSRDAFELVLNRTWRPALEITGADGLPTPASAGNVHRPFTTLKLSLRLPPLLDGASAGRELKKILETDSPYGAKVRFEYDQTATGWNAPSFQPWLAAALDRASDDAWGKSAAYMGEGGTIPFMSMLNRKFPQAQIVVTGVLGPKSNAHGPNEFIDIAYAKKVTAATARVIASLP